MTRGKGSKADKHQDAPGPVRRTRSVTVASSLAFAAGAVMSLYGLFVADSTVFGSGMLLTFGALLVLVGVRFFALAANAQIAAIEHGMASSRPKARTARPATAAHLAAAGKMVRCPRCRHQQAWSADDEACSQCGLPNIMVSH